MNYQSVKPIAHKTPVEDTITLHKKGWVIQRIGWVLMFLFMLLALLGLFGEGPLSNKKVQAGNVTVHYERFCRYEHEAEIKLESNGENIRSVALPQEYLKKFKVSKIIPEPGTQMASPGYINYLFEGSQNNIITFYFEPVGRGNVNGQIKVNDNTISFHQLIYP